MNGLTYIPKYAVYTVYMHHIRMGKNFLYHIHVPSVHSSLAGIPPLADRQKRSRRQSPAWP